MNRLAQNLKLIRKGRWRISQDKFGIIMKSTRSKINSYENGGVEPSIGFILKLASITQLSVREIFYDVLSLGQIPPLPLTEGEDFVAENPPPDYQALNIESVLKNQLKILEQLSELTNRILALENALGKNNS